jgi:hypothetical protein
MTPILVNNAVVGTANAHTPIDNAQTVLRQAGIEALKRRAAYLPPSTQTSLPEIAPGDANLPCDSEVALQLAWLVGSRQMRLQDIWITKLLELQMGLPYEWIVPILERGAGNPIHSHEALLGLLGERGKWLASQQAEWQWIFKQTPFRSKVRISQEDDIATKSFKEIRLRNPDEGREWLIRYWDDLRNDSNRWEYLELLRFGLSKSDEIWLMNIAAGLQDSASDLVHEAQIALQLLSLLPKQALIEDLCQKVFSTLHLNREGKLVLDFVWSVSYEGQLVYKAHIGLTNLMIIFDWRLSLDAILKLIPMKAWTQHFMVSPVELFKAASESSHATVFTDAWAKRILYEREKDFAMAWLGQFANLQLIKAPKSAFATIEADAYELMEILSWHDLVAVLREHVKDA